jgi:hypothetical protein
MQQSCRLTAMEKPTFYRHSDQSIQDILLITELFVEQTLKCIACYFLTVTFIWCHSVATK